MRFESAKHRRVVWLVHRIEEEVLNIHVQGCLCRMCGAIRRLKSEVLPGLSQEDGTIPARIVEERQAN